MTAPELPLRLGEATWTELDATAGDPPILLVPVGSCEQHGPHLPLDTDTRIATAVAEAVAERVEGLLVAPALAVAASGEHQGFPGTLSIGTEASTTVLIELVRSAGWCGGVVFVNGHGGNREAVHDAVALLGHEGRDVLSWWPRLAGADAHAGFTETSLMLAIAPHLVRTALAAAGQTAPLRELLERMEAGGVRSVSPNGVLGDPAGASAAAGQDIFAALVADAVERIDAWRAAPRR